MKQYLKQIKTIIDEGTERGDRTGIGTLSLFGTQARYDLSQHFPLLTTKRLHFKSIVEELIWFIKGSGNIDYLLDKEVSIWNEWKDGTNDLGPVYPVQWRSWEVPRRIVRVEPRLKAPTNLSYPLFPLIEVQEDGLIGQTYVQQWGTIKVLRVSELKGVKNRVLYDIQFQETGTVLTGITKFNIEHGSIKDPYKPIAYGVGAIGSVDFESRFYIKTLYDRWRAMLRRCYDLDSPQYVDYGGKGVFVDSSWHIFEYYLRDIQKIPGWEKARKNLELYNLDKDYWGSNCYSVDTCVWLERGDNALYAKSKPFWVITPEGQKILEISQNDVARKWDLDSSSINQVLHDELKQTHNFGFRFLTPDEIGESLFRYQLSIDQLSDVINSIKKDPSSRRHIISAWNVADLSQMALAPCHSFFQFYVSGGKLSCHLYQRSCDAFLGQPYNIASYSLLTCIIAKLCGLTPGEFVHSIGDHHLYLNHLEQAKEQLSREPKELPRLRLKDFDSIDDFTFEHIELEGYEPWPSIQAPVAI